MVDMRDMPCDKDDTWNDFGQFANIYKFFSNIFQNVSDQPDTDTGGFLSINGSDCENSSSSVDPEKFRVASQLCLQTR